MGSELLKKQQEDEGLVRFECGGQPFSYDLRKVAGALWRVGEVATVSKADAQEMSEAMNDGQAEIQRIVNRANVALEAAEQHVKSEWGRLLLDFVPGELERLGQKDAVDRREAVIRRHPDYLAAQEQERHLRWVVADLRAKKDRCYRAGQTALAVLGERQQFHRGSLSGGGPQKPSSPFGQAKY